MTTPADEPGKAGEPLERDQFWAVLSQLRPAIDALLAGKLAGTQHERDLAKVLAQAVKMELDFRACGADGPPAGGDAR